MTIQGITSYAMPPVVPGNVRTPGAQSPDTSASQGLGAAKGSHAASAGALSRSGETVPAEAPAGTDPMLWSVLTTEERSFFARARSMGQLTYGPGTRNHATSLPTGGRIDVRV